MTATYLTRHHVPPPAFDTDTLEARTIRSEATAKAATERLWYAENQLRAVDLALKAVSTPDASDTLTRSGRIRAIADRARRAELALGRAFYEANP